MQSYLSDMLARERIADLRRDADRARLAARVRGGGWRGRRSRGTARRRGLATA